MCVSAKNANSATPTTAACASWRVAYTSRRTFYAYFLSKKECFIALRKRQNAEVAADPAVELSWIREIPNWAKRPPGGT